MQPTGAVEPKGQRWKSRLFIGSSSGGGLEVARAVQVALRSDAHVTVWDQRVVTAGVHPADALLDHLRKSDFGVFVLTPDDHLIRTEGQVTVARDNVIWEYGLFTGRLGRSRVFMLMPEPEAQFRLPSDLEGVTSLRFPPPGAPPDPSLLASSVGPACTHIRNAIEALGPADHVSFSYHHSELQSLPSSAAADATQGLWLSRFDFEEPGTKRVVRGAQFALEHLRAIGDRTFTGENLLCANSLGRDYRHTLSLERFGSVLIGAWVNRHTMNMGTLQLHVDAMGTRMRGKHLGNASDNSIRHGDWNWLRIDSREPLSESALEALRKRQMSEFEAFESLFDNWFEIGTPKSLREIGLPP